MKTEINVVNGKAVVSRKPVKVYHESREKARAFAKRSTKSGKVMDGQKDGNTFNGKRWYTVLNEVFNNA